VNIGISVFAGIEVVGLRVAVHPELLGINTGHAPEPLTLTVKLDNEFETVVW
jgi:hypothetical protein